MNIVIVGAGDIGSYLAALLSKEENNIILIDLNGEKLATVSRNLDIATRQGSATDWRLLESVSDPIPDLLLALTDNDEINLATATIAKHLGYPQTIARVRESYYLKQPFHLDFNRMFNVDYLIGPELLVASDIFKCISSADAVSVNYFAHGAVQMRTIVIPETWKHHDKKLHKLNLPEGVIVGLICRKRMKGGKEEQEIIFPHGNDHILPNDEVTFIGETTTVNNLSPFFGISKKFVESAIIIGGSVIGINLATMLSNQNVHVKIIEKDRERCKKLTELLSNATILNHDGTDMDFLLSEVPERADVFVACTREDEVNMLAAMLGREIGCENIIASISNTSYLPIMKRLGIRHAFSPRISTANHILSVIRAKTITAMSSLYEGRAEIIEFKVPLDSQICGIPLAHLGPRLPKDFLIAVIQHRGHIMIARGNCILCPGDTMIAVGNPEHVSEIQKLF